MTVFHSALILQVWLVVLTMTGRGVAHLLPLRLRPHAKLYFSPALGLAVYIIVATATGWLIGANSLLVVSATLILTGAGLTRERDWAGLGKTLLWVSITGGVASAGIFVSIDQFGAYPVYNDTYTYLVHSQWLQEHAFREPADASAFHPAYTQVALYQGMGLRMGASFVLAWIQASTPLTWSIQVYPAVMAIFLAVGASSISGLVAVLAPSRRRIALAWGIPTALSLNGFSYGVIGGFAAQTCGLALLPALFGLISLFIPPQSPSLLWRAAATLPLALLFTAIGFAYSEILPFVGATVTCWFVVRILSHPAHALQWLGAGLVFVVVSLVIWNVELLRIVKALEKQSQALVGWPVAWPAIDFFGHAAGLRSGSGDGDLWIVPIGYASSISAAIFGVFLLAPFLAAAARRRGFGRVAGSGAFLGLTTAAFLYFRYGVETPWPTGLGQTWNQFKLSNWASPVALAAIGAGMSLFSKRAGWQAILYLGMGMFAGTSFFHHVQLAKPRVAEILSRTGVQANPFSVYEHLREAAIRVSPDNPVYLDLGGHEHKSRQLFTYYFHDLPVIADWSDDGYIYPWLDPAWRNIPMSSAHWWIRRIAQNSADAGVPTPFKAGALELVPAPELLVVRESVAGGHGVESDSSGWWVWSPDTCVITFRIRSALPVEARIRLQFLPTAPPRTIRITKEQGGSRTEYDLPRNEGWQTWVSEPFAITTQTIVIEVFSPQPPVPISSTDHRPAAFLIKNVSLEAEPVRR